MPVTQNVSKRTKKKKTQLSLNSPSARYKNTQILLAGHKLETSKRGEAISVSKQRFGACACRRREPEEEKPPERVRKSVTLELLKAAARARV